MYQKDLQFSAQLFVLTLKLPAVLKCVVVLCGGLMFKLISLLTRY